MWERKKKAFGEEECGKERRRLVKRNVGKKEEGIW